MIAPYTIRYLLASLEGTPSVLSALVADVSPDSPVWDARPDPERFTLREMIAHLADWEPVCRERIFRTRVEKTPHLPNWDEEQAALIGDYAHTNPYESLLWYTERRAATVALLTALEADEWTRTAERENVGTLSIEKQAFLILAHDGFHLRQTVELKGA